MPKVKGRGRVIRTRAKKVSKNKYMVCDVYTKEGPRGGKTVCHVKTKKKEK